MSAQENKTTDVAAMFRDMPVPSMLSLMLSMNGLRNAGQQELFETKNDLFLRRGQTGFSKRDIFNKSAPPMMRMPVEDYFLLSFASAVESTKQMPLFSEEQLPSATSLTNFLGAPKGFCSSGQETAAKQKSPSRQP